MCLKASCAIYTAEYSGIKDSYKIEQKTGQKKEIDL
jgi:hypothetical protein